MLFLQFQLGNDRYVLDASQIVEVLPLVAIKRIPKAPTGVAGALNYRGMPVPAVDLSALLLGQPAKASMSTRIIVVNYPDEHGEMIHHLGLLAEKATETVRHEPADFSDTGVNDPETPCLGPVIKDAKGLVQWVDASRLLPDAVRDVLFKAKQREGH